MFYRGISLISNTYHLIWLSSVGILGPFSKSKAPLILDSSTSSSPWCYHITTTHCMGSGSWLQKFGVDKTGHLINVLSGTGMIHTLAHMFSVTLQSKTPCPIIFILSHKGPLMINKKGYDQIIKYSNVRSHF